VKLAEVIRAASEILPDNAILTNGAATTRLPARYFEYKSYRTQLAPTSGSMGYGLPAAIAAQLAHPDRPVVNFQGDGCFLMTGRSWPPPCSIRSHHHRHPNNGMYGTIRMHQEREYPSRVVGTTLVNPDFAAYARSFGADGYTVETTADFAPALRSALKAANPPSSS
jgi:acetolactate synthase-1/2/3 large subunit